MRARCPLHDITQRKDFTVKSAEWFFNCIKLRNYPPVYPSMYEMPADLAARTSPSLAQDVCISFSLL